MSKMRQYLATSVVALGVLSVAGCKDRQERMSEEGEANEPGVANEDPSPVNPASVQLPSVNNGEAAAMLRAVHQGQIDETNAVMAKLQSEPAKKLAKMIVEEPTAAQRELDRILSSSGISAQENDKVRELKKDSQDNVRELNETETKDLDMKYIDLQIEEHEDALELLDDKLIEKANDPALSKFLRDQRGAIASRLEHAKQAKEDLKAMR